jgi:hypothetical protein
LPRAAATIASRTRLDSGGFGEQAQHGRSGQQTVG